MQPLRAVESEPRPSVGLPASASVDRLRAVLGTAGEHLGDLVWWTLAEATLGREAVHDVWSRAQLSTGLLPEPPTAEKALRLAIRACQVGHPEYLLRLAKDADDDLVYAIVREHKPGDGTVQHHQEARVLLQRLLGSLGTDSPEHPMVRAIEEAFVTHRNVHTPDDLRRTLVKTLKSFAAVTLREGGGIYWVPRAYAAELRRLEGAVAQWGRSQCHVVPVHHTVQAAQTLGAVARGSIEQELEELRKEMEAFQAEPPERPSTLERRLETFEAVRTRAQLYRDILRVQVEDLESQLDSMGDQVRKLLAGAT